MIERVKQKRGEGGFTLIELLIVIIILAILAAIVVFAVGTTATNSKKAACDADAKSVETAVEAFKAQNQGAWPSAMADLTSSNSNGGPWLREAPTATVANNGYAISLAANGVVDVTVGTTTTNFDTTPDPCSSIQ